MKWLTKKLKAMRKIIIALIAAYVLTFNTFGGTPIITITMSGCGKKGCNYLRETHSGDVHTLKCEGKGYTKCEFQYLPGFFNNSVVNSLIEHATDNIENGIYSGSFTLINYTVVWNHDTSIEKSIIEIFINE